MAQVVIGDSFALTRFVLARAVEAAGFSAIQADSARAIVKELCPRNGTRHLVVDLDCLNCGGPVLVRYLRQSPMFRHVRIIGLAYARREPMTFPGVDVVLVKENFTRTELVRRLQELVGAPVAKAAQASAGSGPTTTSPSPEPEPAPDSPTTALAASAPAGAPSPASENTSDWPSTDSAVDVPAGAPVPGPLSEAEVEEAVAGVATLRALRPIVHDVLRLCDDPRSEIGDLVRVVRNDPSLTARLIGASNSPTYRRKAPVTGLQDAISLMGFKGTRDLALSLTLIDEIDESGITGRLSHHKLLAHDLATSFLAEAFANATGSVDPGRAFVAGLLHDFGRQLMAWQLPAHYAAVMNLLGNSAVSVMEAESRIAGTDHAAIGSRVMARWACPDFLVHAVAMHHADALWDPAFSDTQADLLRILRVADGLATALGYEVDENDDLEHLPVAALPQCLQSVHPDLPELLGRLHDRICTVLRQSIPAPASLKPARVHPRQVVVLGTNLSMLDPLQALIWNHHRAARFVRPGQCDPSVPETLVLFDARSLEPAYAMSKLQWLHKHPAAPQWSVITVGLPYPADTREWGLPTDKLAVLPPVITPRSVLSAITRLNSLAERRGRLAA